MMVEHFEIKDQGFTQGALTQTSHLNRLSARQLEKNNGIKPHFLRNGMLITIMSNPARSSQDYTGLWRIVSIKANNSGAAIDIIRPQYITARNGVIWSGMNKTLGPLLNAGLILENNPLTSIKED